MTTKEIAEYLKLHEITICKYVKEGLIPAFLVGRVWRFEKENIDKWIREGQGNPHKAKRTKAKSGTKGRKRGLPKTK
jgi:excisionase family DNA binding protein